MQPYAHMYGHTYGLVRPYFSIRNEIDGIPAVEDENGMLHPFGGEMGGNQAMADDGHEHAPFDISDIYAFSPIEDFAAQVADAKGVSVEEALEAVIDYLLNVMDFYRICAEFRCLFPFLQIFSFIFVVWVD
jgi:hypothetical protein